MSTTVDSRVAELRFDNSQFEKNVSTSMSTLDKLKEKLNLTGASKGLEDVNKAVNGIDFSKAEATATKAGFHIQDVWMKVATTFEQQIANKIVNAATNMFNQIVTAAPKDGFQEYEMTLNAVQTTMAGTGKTAEEVEKELKKLDDYADKTVYSTSDMLNNLPKFTNAGVELEQATKAMIGISNATAHAGGDASKASIAFYNLGQAIGTGYLSRMDYNSINNAGIATMQWKEAMVEAAIAQGTLTKVGEDSYKAGNKTLTLQQLFIDGLQEQWATTDVMMKVFGDYGDETTEIGKAAYAAAQDVKTFTMMMDSLKATAGTGWKETWQIIFGGLDDAKKLWTGISNFLSNIITTVDDTRNYILSSALGRGFTGIGDRLKGMFDPLKDAAGSAISTIENLDEIARRVIRGDYKNTDTGRRELLMADGYNWAIVQNRVNELKGCSVRWSEEAGEAELREYQIKHGLIDANDDLSESYGKTIDQLAALSDAELEAAGYTEDQIKALRELEKVAKKLGLPLSELIAKIDEIDGRWLIINSFKTIGQSMVTIVKSIGKAWNDVFAISKDDVADGLFNVIAALHRFSQSLKVSDETADKLRRTFRGLFAALDLIFTLIGGPIRIAFKLLIRLLGMFDLDLLSITASIGDVIVKFNDWVNSNNFIMRGLYKLVDVIRDVVVALWEMPAAQKAFKQVSNGVSTATKSVSKGFKYWKEYIGDLVSGVRDGSMTFGQAIGKFASTARKKFLKLPFIKTISKWIKSFLALPGVQKYINKFSGVLDKLKNKLKEVFGNGFTGVKDALIGVKNIGKHIIEGIIEGLKDGSFSIKDTLINIANFMINTFKKILGIHSPSTVFMAIGGFIIAGLLTGLLNGTGSITGFFTGLGGSISKILNSIPWGEIFVAGISAGTLVLLAKVASMLSSFLGAIGGLAEGFADLMSGVGRVLWKSARSINKVIKATARVLNSFALVMTSVAIVNIAIALAILAGSIMLFSLIPIPNLWNAVGAIAVLALVLGGLAAGLMALQIFGGSKGVVSDAKNPVVSVAKTLMALAASILIIAIALKIVSSIDRKELNRSVEGIVEIIKSVAMLMLAYTILGKFSPVVKQFGAMMLSIAGMFLAIAIAMKTLASLSEQELLRAQTAIFTIMVVLGVLMAGLTIASRFSKGVPIGFGVNMLLIAGAMLILALVVKMIASVPGDEKVFSNVLNTLIGLSLILFSFGLIIKLAGNKLIGDIGRTLIAIAGAFAILALIALILGKVKWETLGRGAVALLGLVVISAILMHVVKVAGKNAPGIGPTLIAIAGSIAILAAIAVLLGFVNPKTVWKGIGAVAALVVLIGGLMWASKFTNGVQMGPLIAIAAMIALLATALIILAQLNTTKLIAAAVGLSIVLFTMMMVFNSLSMVKVPLGPMIVLTVCIGLLATALSIMSFMPWQQSLAAAGALSLALVALIVALNVLSKSTLNMGNITNGVIGLVLLCIPLSALAAMLHKMRRVDNAVESVLALSGFTAVLGLLLVELSYIGKTFDVGGTTKAIVALAALWIPLSLMVDVLKKMSGVKNAEKNAGALSNFALALSVVLLALGGVGAIIKAIDIGNMVLAMVGFVAILGSLYLMVDILKKMSGVQNAAQNATVLALFAGALTVILLALAGVGAIYSATGGMAALGLAGFAAIIVLLYAVVGVLALMSMVPNAATSALALTVLISAIGEVCFKLALVAPLLIVAVAALAGFSALIIALGAFALVIGGLVTMFPKLKTFIDNGIPILISLAGCLGKMVGAFIGGVSNAICNTLPQIGEALSTFSENSSGFVSGMKQVDEKVLAGVGIMAAAILALTAADLINGVVTLLKGGSSFSDLGTDLSEFMTNALPFIMISNTIRPECLQGVKYLAEAILILTASNLLDGIVSFFTGENSLAKFGEELGQLGTDMKTFVDNLGTFSEEQVKTVECAGKAISALAKATSEIPNTGGLWQAIVGESGLASLSGELPSLGTNLKGFMTNLGTFDDTKLNTVDIACKAIKYIAEASKEIGNTGGLWQAIIGESGLASLSGELPSLGTNLSAFIKNLTQDGAFDESAASTVEIAGKALAALAEASQKMPASGGWIQKICGDGSDGFKKFAEVLPDVATGIKNFVTNLGDFSGSEASVTEALNFLTLLANMGETGFDSITKGIQGLGLQLYNFALDLGKFNKVMKDSVGSRELGNAIEKINMLKDMCASLSGVDMTEVYIFGAELKRLGTEAITGFVEAFTGPNPVTAVNNGVKAMIAEVVYSIASGKDTMLHTASLAGSDVAESFGDSTAIQSAYDAGSAVVDGFCKGISENTYKAAAKAKAMAEAAVETARWELEINSPSKVFEAIGGGVPEGFALGIDKLTYLATGSVEEMGKSAVAGISGAIAKITDAVNTDMDFQPTIRPVLDLSEVTAGAGAVNGLFSAQSLGVRANLGSISSSMNNNQNGATNDDVVDLLKALREDLHGSGSTTYNYFNGITGGNEEAVNDAINVLIRAARLDRRS